MRRPIALKIQTCNGSQYNLHLLFVFAYFRKLSMSQLQPFQLQTGLKQVTETDFWIAMEK